jgi:hypothetical protein
MLKEVSINRSIFSDWIKKSHFFEIFLPANAFFKINFGGFSKILFKYFTALVLIVKTIRTFEKLLIQFQLL